MTYTYTQTATDVLTKTRRVGAKIAADLLQMHELYAAPSETDVGNFGEEAAMLMRDGYAATIQYGFKRNGRVVFMLEYVIGPGGVLDESPGRVPWDPNAVGAEWFSFLTYSPKWWGLSDAQRGAYKASLPIKRSSADAPVLAPGNYYGTQKTYSTDSVSVRRAIFRSDS